MKTSLSGSIANGKWEKKESLVVKPSVGSATIISTLKKQQLPKEQEKPEANQGLVIEFAGGKEVKIAPAKVVEKTNVDSLKQKQGSSEASKPDVSASKKKSVGVSAQDDTYNFKVSVPEHTGKEKQRQWEWVKFRTQIKVRLITGDVYQGYLRWYDRYAIKLITATDEIIIPKHSILCFFDEPKSREIQS